MLLQLVWFHSSLSILEGGSWALGRTIELPEVTEVNPSNPVRRRGGLILIILDRALGSFA